ncbi:ATP-dependent DNA ligase [Neiella marina]|uniref:ATP-dependent DNA ligase n=2 Tax=Neiella marina TaxID=508461 RepID=A0A8J2U6C5_9GAMM|nr:DNA ligase [Neiella marina]GGA81569.1 ATP-dependent DNA ligase [Neiella marina]
MLKSHTLTLIGCALLPAPALLAGQHPQPPLMLASEYQEHIQLGNYLVSEKFDGIRAFWDGQHLLTRSGNLINAPDWFTQGFPKIPLDGELWFGYGQFSQLTALLNSATTQQAQWRNVLFMVFDLPTIRAPFDMRYGQLGNLLEQLDHPQLQRVEQQTLSTDNDVRHALAKVLQRGGEGLMFRHRNSLYEPKRSMQLLKLKPWQDAEAEVIGHRPGQGKYSGQLGALVVRAASGQIFKIGTGFSDQERRQPPSVGTTITYRYSGFTNSGKPRFASYMRPRLPE